MSEVRGPAGAGEALFLAADFLCPPVEEGARELCGVSYQGDSTFMTEALPKAPPHNTLTLGIRISTQTYTFGGHGHSDQSNKHTSGYFTLFPLAVCRGHPRQTPS